MTRDEETRSPCYKKGYRVLELYYEHYRDKRREYSYQKTMTSL